METEYGSTNDAAVFQLRLRLRGVSPAIWRRLLVSSNTTIADFHRAIQLAMGWDDEYLHQFLIRGKRYGVGHVGSWGFWDNAFRVRLADFDFRPNEKFRYEYNFYAGWRLEIRFEGQQTRLPGRFYPVCIGGKRGAPLDAIRGPWRFMELKDRYSLATIEARLLDILNAPDLEERRWVYAAEVEAILPWLDIYRFDRQETNQRLQAAFTMEEKRP